MVISVLLLILFHIMCFVIKRQCHLSRYVSLKCNIILFTTTANVQVDRNFYSPPVSEQELYSADTKNLVSFFNLLMCLTVQCCHRSSARTFNSSHVAGPGVPYGSENM